MVEERVQNWLVLGNSEEGEEREQLTGVEVIVAGAAWDRMKLRVALLALVLIQHRKEGRVQSPIYSCTLAGSVQHATQFRGT